MKNESSDVDNDFDKTIGEGGEIMQVSEFLIKGDGHFFSVQYESQKRK